MTKIALDKDVATETCRMASEEEPDTASAPSSPINRTNRGRRSLRFAAAAFVCFGATFWCNQSRSADASAGIAAADANAARIMSGYDAFSRGDIEGALAVFADNILWHVPGRGPLSHDYHGRTEVLGFFKQFMDLSNGTFRVKIDNVLAKGDQVVVLCTETAQRGSRSWSSPQIHVWTVKDGRATVFWQYQGDQQTEDEFWSLHD